MKLRSQNEKAEYLFSLHKGGELLVLPNVWNLIGARILAHHQRHSAQCRCAGNRRHRNRLRRILVGVGSDVRAGDRIWCRRSQHRRWSRRRRASHGRGTVPKDRDHQAGCRTQVSASGIPADLDYIVILVMCCPMKAIIVEKKTANSIAMIILIMTPKEMTHLFTPPVSSSTGM